MNQLIKQYIHFKGKSRNALVFMRVGDFFETFNNDAVIASEVCGLTITHRDNIQIAGIPYHSIDGYLKKLIQAGYRVALCEQIEKPTDKVIKRDIVRITEQSITPVI